MKCWAVLFAGVIGATLAASAEENNYNVLFITVDDLNTDIGCYGAKHVKTPHMDRMAGMGMRFDRAYCQVAVCGASRQSLMFGLRPNTTGVFKSVDSTRTKNPSAVSLPELFRKNDIYTARVGKIYHYMNPAAIGSNGHDDAPSWDERFNPSGMDITRQSEILLSKEGEWVKAEGAGLGKALACWDPESKDEEHTDGMVANKVIELLEEHKGERFFIAAGFYKPHCPYVAPKHYFDMYPLDEVEVPDMARELADRDDVPKAATGTNRLEDVPLEHIRRLRQSYYASTTFVDAQIGRVLDALEEKGLRENTIIVFLSDHGYFLGEKSLWYKLKNYERTLRSPMMIVAPGMKNGECKRIVEFIDLYPTIAELAGLKPQSKLEGVSLKPLLIDPEQVWDRPAIGQNKKGYSIRKGHYRFCRWGDSLDDWELYDHRVDSEKRTNLIRKQQSLELAQQLNKELITYIKVEAPKPVKAAKKQKTRK